jgi:hypothetical protein
MLVNESEDPNGVSGKLSPLTYQSKGASETSDRSTSTPKVNRLPLELFLGFLAALTEEFFCFLGWKSPKWQESASVRHDLKKVKTKPPVNVRGQSGAKGGPFASLSTQWIRWTLYGTGCCYQKTTKIGKMLKRKRIVTTLQFDGISTRWLFDSFFHSRDTLPETFY